MKISETTFEVFKGKRPKVLLLGNGLNQAYSEISWDDMLDDIKDKDKYKEDAKNYIMPMPLKAAMLTGNKLAGKMHEIVKERSKSGQNGGDVSEDNGKKRITWEYFATAGEELRTQIRNLVSGFDYVLTTNYSYEIEMALLDTGSLKIDRITKMMNFHEVDNAQTQFLINTFNLVKGVPVWHIHGEARKPDSMIIGHEYYGKQLKRCVERIDGVRIENKDGKKNRKDKYTTQRAKDDEYRKNITNRKAQKIGSWIDAFVLGDVYILGFSMDMSESDLWWLISYKAAKKDICGKTVFYDPIKDTSGTCVEDKYLPCEKSLKFISTRQCRDYLLEDTYGVKVENLNFTLKSREQYKEFYPLAIEDIQRCISP